MYIRGLDQVNNPSDGVEREVGSGIFMKTEAPHDTEIAEITPIVTGVRLQQYCVYRPVFYGYNKYGILVSTDMKNVKLSSADDFGKIEGDKFIAYGIEEQLITGTYNGFTVSIPVTVEQTGAISMRHAKVLNDRYLEYPIEVLATVGDQKIPLYLSAVSWSVDDASVVAIDSEKGSLQLIQILIFDMENYTIWRIKFSSYWIGKWNEA